MHYDDVHIEKFRGKKKVPSRASDYKVFQSVAQAHRKQLCQRVALPKAVKDILRCPVAALSTPAQHPYHLLCLGLESECTRMCIMCAKPRRTS